LNTTFTKSPAVVRANDELMDDSETHNSLANAEQEDADAMEKHEMEFNKKNEVKLTVKTNGTEMVNIN
jgi:spore coat protein CotH